MKIVQVSDVHGSRAVLGELENLTRGADLLVVSGDVTTFADGLYFDEFMASVRRAKVPTLYVPGNNDLPNFILPEGIVQLDGRKHEFGGLIFGGLGGSPPTPFGTPNEIPEELLSERLKSLGRVDILVSHSPPFDTPADALRGGGHAGSRAVREYVLQQKPRLVLCGHIHEAVSKFTLKESEVVNPGPALLRRYARINIEREITASLLLF